MRRYLVLLLLVFLTALPVMAQDTDTIQDIRLENGVTLALPADWVITEQTPSRLMIDFDDIQLLLALAPAEADLDAGAVLEQVITDLQDNGTIEGVPFDDISTYELSDDTLYLTTRDYENNGEAIHEMAVAAGLVDNQVMMLFVAQGDYTSVLTAYRTLNFVLRTVSYEPPTDGTVADNNSGDGTVFGTPQGDFFMPTPELWLFRPTGESSIMLVSAPDVDEDMTLEIFFGYNDDPDIAQALDVFFERILMATFPDFVPEELRQEIIDEIEPYDVGDEDVIVYTTVSPLINTVDSVIDATIEERTFISYRDGILLLVFVTPAENDIMEEIGALMAGTRLLESPSSEPDYETQRYNNEAGASLAFPVDWLVRPDEESVTAFYFQSEELFGYTSVLPVARLAEPVAAEQLIIDMMKTATEGGRFDAGWSDIQSVTLPDDNTAYYVVYVAPEDSDKDDEIFITADIGEVSLFMRVLLTDGIDADNFEFPEDILLLVASADLASE